MVSGQCGLHGAHGRERMSEVKLKDLLHGSEFVLTYEDKDGDWMLVGDVPWPYVFFFLINYDLIIELNLLMIISFV